MSDSGDQPTHISRWQRSADFFSLSLLYLEGYFVPHAAAPLRPRRYAPGHWGCVTGLNAIWANLVAFGEATGQAIEPLVGTGHGGAAWVSWLVLQGQYPTPTTSAAELDSLIAGFGKPGGVPTELFAGMPGVRWPAGELGHALAVAQGLRLAAPDRPTVAILGDGEVEIGNTLSALYAGATLAHRPLIIINHNQLRMGSNSRLAYMPDGGRAMFESMGYRVSVVNEGDWEAFQRALAIHVVPGGMIVYRNRKGGTIPDLAGQAFTTPDAVHKLPVKSLESENATAWLRAWLDELAPPGVFAARGIDRTRLKLHRQGQPLLAPSRSAGGKRIAVSALGSTVLPADRSCSSAEAFSLEAYRLSQGRLAVFSPDEATSNRLPAALGVTELLSEQTTLGWAFGSILAGKPAMHASYEGFATTMLSMCVQFARFLESESLDDAGVAPLAVLLTSLSWRNVDSHQDVGFVDDIGRRRLDRWVSLIPPEPALAAQAAHFVYGRHRDPLPRIGLVLAEKVPFLRRHTLVRRDLAHGLALYSDASTPTPGGRVLLLVIGEACFSEAVAVCDYFRQMAPSVRCDILCPWIFAGEEHSRAVLSGIANVADDYDVVVCSAMSPVARWADMTNILGHLRHARPPVVFAPQTGINEVVRLRQLGLDWLAQAQAIAGSFGLTLIHFNLSAASAGLDLRLQVSSGSPTWYYTRSAVQLASELQDLRVTPR